ncbi:MAG TPA: beta-methylgalactoside transporter [Candidatus Pullichristensenella excrementigallinarum]|uniref:Beta-methylgalactoside transporter n=1 Tax=Candidatus Pullichristensenella excrementigallinarum TaxID=2840907 RepID=A0A9D1LC59_9FIRM|nr:beta-methylgalactoside transporter [Candidatus Pullichristensenella excrementigallinarum]
MNTNQSSQVVQSKKKPMQSIGQFVTNNAIMLCLIVMVLVIICIEPNFASLRVLRNVAEQNSTKLIMACGMAFVLIVGGVDLSAGRVMGFAAVITASLGQTIEYTRLFYPNMGQLPFFVPLLAAMAVGALFGAFNGFIISRFKITAFIVTLGTQVIAWGVNLLYFDIEPNSSQPIGGVQQSITNLGSGLIANNIPIVLLIAIAVCLLCWFILSKTRFGRNTYAIGGNAEAALVSGIRVQRVQIGVYALAGVLYGLAGFLECARTGGATSAYGLNYEFDAISACVVGGVSNTGGIGTVPGMILGVLVFGIINYGLTFIGVNPYWQQIIKGIIIIAAVGVDMSKNRKRK